MVTITKETLISTEDLESWDDKKYADFFIFQDFFYGIDGKIHATKEIVQAVQQYKLASPFIVEMLEKINVPFDPKKPEEWNYRKFFMRLQVIIRVVKNKLKAKPGVLLPSLAVEQLKKKHCEWMKEIYEDDGTPKLIKVLSTRPPKELLIINDEEISPGQKLINAIGKVADVYDMIAGSIKPEDIQKLDTKDKINALQKLFCLYSAMKKTPPKNLNFIKINSKTGGKEELENAILDFSNEEE